MPFTTVPNFHDKWRQWYKAPIHARRARNPIGNCVDPFMARSASASPSTGMNLNPCPLNPHAIHVRAQPGMRSTMKCWSGLLVYRQIALANAGPAAAGMNSRVMLRISSISSVVAGTRGASGSHGVPAPCSAILTPPGASWPGLLGFRRYQGACDQLV